MSTNSQVFTTTSNVETFSINFETIASELLVNLDGMFLQYYMYPEVCSSTKSLTVLQ